MLLMWLDGAVVCRCGAVCRGEGGVVLDGVCCAALATYLVPELMNKLTVVVADVLYHQLVQL